MARTASPQHRTQLEQMAATWEQLAAARQRQLRQAPEDGIIRDERGQTQPTSKEDAQRSSGDVRPRKAK
jgi:hypothetical protein